MRVTVFDVTTVRLRTLREYCRGPNWSYIRFLFDSQDVPKWFGFKNVRGGKPTPTLK